MDSGLHEFSIKERSNPRSPYITFKESLEFPIFFKKFSIFENCESLG